MMEYGCIARKLGHSFSRDIHAQIDNYDYRLQEVAPEALGEFLTQRNFRGINVTIPYKQDAIAYLDSISDTARAIGAVNTIVRRGDRLEGHNTDFGGMRALLGRMGLSLTGKKVMILGTGGTSKTAHAVAESLHARQIVTVSRRPGDGVVTYETAMQAHTDTQILLNTTPVGMFPDVDPAPIALQAFPALEGVMDAIYNPLRSSLVLDAQSRGIPAQGGLYMLVAQAVLAARIFTGKAYPDARMREIHASLLREKCNLVLVGMPASGKTTVGKALASSLGRPFVDLDDEIVRADGRPIPEIFAAQGETFFRDLESRVTQQFALHGGQVIATGGGCVLRSENVRRLRQNGLVFWIDRPLAQLLPTADRPTANSTEKIRALYDTRRPLYAAGADVHIDSDGVAAHVANAILHAFDERTKA